MTTAIALGLISVLVALAVLHGYWGLGGRWPGHDDASLVALVVGRTKDMRAPPPPACFGVAAALLGTASLVYLRALSSLAGGQTSVVSVGVYGAALLFLLRGLAGYMPAVTRYASGTPFHRLNRELYSPLCITIGAALVLVG